MDTSTVIDEAPQSHPNVAVIGGGISGLAAAHRLIERDPACRITLLEAGSRLGGVISTVHADGFQVEQSADNFITTVPWGVSLCQRVGLAEELITTNPAHRHTFVVHKGRLCKLPDGFLMMAPTRLWPLALTPILSPLGKLRAALEYFIPPRTSEEDESMAAFVRRRLGREAFQRLVEPLVSSVYAADLEKLSLDATLSQFREMEREHGSLIRAMRRRMAAARSAPTDSGARYSMFVTPRRGLSSLVEAVAARLPAGAVRLNARVERIQWTADGRWQVFSAGRGGETFDALILATPSYETARLLEPIDAELSADLARIEHSGTAIVSVGYERDQVGHPLNGMGAVVPAVENSPLLACSFSSQKYAHRAPAGRVLLRVFAGGARHPELAEMDDQRLAPLLLAELAGLLRIRGEPVYSNIAHWPRTMPQYHVGHLGLVARIEARAALLSGLALAGNAFRGVGIPHCIHSGEAAAERIVGSGQ
jgi:oxygen-dependent protoporphyrinogen oxidase